MRSVHYCTVPSQNTLFLKIIANYISNLLSRASLEPVLMPSKHLGIRGTIKCSSITSRNQTLCDQHCPIFSALKKRKQVDEKFQVTLFGIHRVQGEPFPQAHRIESDSFLNILFTFAPNSLCIKMSVCCEAKRTSLRGSVV